MHKLIIIIYLLLISAMDSVCSAGSIDLKAQNQLLEACKKGKLRIVKNLVTKKMVHINATIGRYDSTPLMITIASGHLGVMRYLVEHGAHIHRCSDYDEDPPPLIRAASSGHLDMVQYLISQGAQINKTTAHGFSPLMGAICRGHFHIVQYLVQQGAYVNQNTRYSTPLINAIDNNQLAITECLVANGADVNKPERPTGKTPLIAAVQRGSYNIVKCLIANGVDITSLNHRHETALHCAAKRGYLDIVAILLEGIKRQNNLQRQQLL